MIKNFFILILVILFLTFGGCLPWWEEPTQTITFDNFQIDIPENYNQIRGEMIDNKQITNKIVKAYRHPERNDFRENLIISSTNLDGINSREFSEVNLNKLNRKMWGININENTSHNPGCTAVEEGFYTHMEVYENIFDENPSYYLSQYYIVKWNTWYIISMASDEEWKKDEFQQYLTSLRCQ